MNEIVFVKFEAALRCAGSAECFQVAIERGLNPGWMDAVIAKAAEVPRDGDTDEYMDALRTATEDLLQSYVNDFLAKSQARIDAIYAETAAQIAKRRKQFARDEAVARAEAMSDNGKVH